MKCIILCAGYATRLYPLTQNTPKALLPIKDKPLIEYIIERLPEQVDETIIVSNHNFYPHFLEWSKKYNNVKILDDGTTNNEERLGGVIDLALAIKEHNINEDFLLVLGDLLFNFNLQEFADQFEKDRKPLIGSYEVSMEEIRRLGAVIADDSKVISIVEKPQKPITNLAVTGIYIFRKEDIPFILDYIKSDKPKEGPTYLFADLADKEDTESFTFEGRWVDIGTITSYNEVKEYW